MKTTKTIMKIMDENVAKLISAMYGRYSKYTDIDDLLQEAYLATLKASREFDSNRGTKKSTYIWKCAKNHLINFVKTESRYIPLDGQLNSAITNVSPERQYLLKETINSLSKEARSVIKMILDCPGEFACGGYVARVKLRRMLKESGWKDSKIKAVFEEIRNALREYYQAV